MPSGYIHVIIGPMYSGKTTELQRIITRYSLAGKKTTLLKQAKDTRYDADFVCSHDNRRMEALTVVSLQKTLVENFDVIGIDEGNNICLCPKYNFTLGQFFEDIATFADQLANDGKIVVIAALSSDFRRQPFPEITPLLSIA